MHNEGRGGCGSDLDGDDGGGEKCWDRNYFLESEHWHAGRDRMGCEEREESNVTPKLHLGNCMDGDI